MTPGREEPRSPRSPEPACGARHLLAKVDYIVEGLQIDGVGKAVLGQLNVAAPSCKRANETRPLFSNECFEDKMRRTRIVGSWGGVDAAQSSIAEARTSTLPYWAAGHFFAHSSATSRSDASMTKYPPRVS